MAQTTRDFTPYHIRERTPTLTALANALGVTTDRLRAMLAARNIIVAGEDLRGLVSRADVQALNRQLNPTRQ